MSQKPDSFQAFQHSPQAEELLKNRAALDQLLSSPETRQLMQLLDQQGGDKLKTAARAAAGGKPESLMQLLNQVMESRDGAQAVENLRKKAGQ